MVRSNTDEYKTVRPVAEAVEAVRSGHLVLLAVGDGDGDRGDLMLAAEHASPEALNTMLTQARGLLCLALGDESYNRLGLRPDPIADGLRNPRAPGATTTIEAAEGVSTGISSADRTRTIRAATAAGATPEDVRQPGHVPVVRSAPGGVTERQSPTEAAVELAKLAGFGPAAVICDVLGPDGEMADRRHLEAVAAACGAVILSVELLAATLRGSR